MFSLVNKVFFFCVFFCFFFLRLWLFNAVAVTGSLILRFCILQDQDPKAWIGWLVLIILSKSFTRIYPSLGAVTCQLKVIFPYPYMLPIHFLWNYFCGIRQTEIRKLGFVDNTFNFSRIKQSLYGHFVIRCASSCWSSTCLYNFLIAGVDINGSVTIGFIWKLWDIMLQIAQWKILCDR